MSPDWIDGFLAGGLVFSAAWAAFIWAVWKWRAPR